MYLPALFTLFRTNSVSSSFFPGAVRSPRHSDLPKHGERCRGGAFLNITQHGETSTTETLVAPKHELLHRSRVAKRP
jgi:hypothetical protein